jgi:lysophospholipase L1-like esterase
MKKRLLFVVVTVGLSLTLSLLIAFASLYFYANWAKNTDKDVPPILLRLSTIRKIFSDKHYHSLLEAVGEGEGEDFETVWDFDTGVALSKDLFIPTEMFGTMKYRYRPNIQILNAAVWSGVHYADLVLPATPAITDRLRYCFVRRNITFETDENGFKKTDYPIRDGAPTILFLGNSFTEGLWVESQDTFVNQFGNILATRGIDASVINLGVDGYGVLEMCWMVEQFAPKFDPNLVVLNLFPNDVHSDYIKVIKDDDVSEENYTALFRYLTRIRDYCREHHIEMIVSLIPCKEQIEDLWQSTAFQERVSGWCEKNGVLVIDPLGLFRQLGLDEVYFTWDPHFSEEGHKRYADFLFHNMEQMSTTFRDGSNDLDRLPNRIPADDPK